MPSVEQGCPFSPALFATLIAGALERVRAGLRLLDESAAVLSYFNDIYIVVSPEHAGRALNYVDQAFSRLDLTLIVAKCKWWCGQAGVAPTGLPATVQRAGVLPVLASSGALAQRLWGLNFLVRSHFLAKFVVFLILMKLFDSVQKQLLSIFAEICEHL